jgi:hypothetical protein
MRWLANCAHLRLQGVCFERVTSFSEAQAAQVAGWLLSVAARTESQPLSWAVGSSQREAHPTARPANHECLCRCWAGVPGRKREGSNREPKSPVSECHSSFPCQYPWPSSEKPLLMLTGNPVCPRRPRKQPQGSSWVQTYFSTRSAGPCF